MAARGENGRWERGLRGWEGVGAEGMGGWWVLEGWGIVGDKRLVGWWVLRDWEIWVLRGWEGGGC